MFGKILIGGLIVIYLTFVGAWMQGYRIIRPNDKEDDQVQFNGQQNLYHK